MLLWLIKHSTYVMLNYMDEIRLEVKGSIYIPLSKEIN